MRHTNDVSLVLLYLVCAVLLVLVVAGWRLLSRPGAPDNRLLMLLKAHRWEALLLLGLPIAAGALHLGLTVGALDTNNALLWEHKHYVSRVLVLAALVVAYPSVRRQGIELLTLLWQLLMVLKAISLAINGVEALTGYSGIIFSHEVIYGGLFDQAVPINIVSVRDILWALTVVWFMRLASRTSLSRAFLLLGLSMAYGTFSLHDVALQSILASSAYLLQDLSIIGGGLANLVLQVGLNVLMFWVLTRHEALDTEAMRSAAILLVTAGLLFPLVSSTLVIGSLVMGDWLAFGYSSLYLSEYLNTYAVGFAQRVAEVLLVALLAYLVRVRRPVDPSGMRVGESLC